MSTKLLPWLVMSMPGPGTGLFQPPAPPTLLIVSGPALAIFAPARTPSSASDGIETRIMPPDGNRPQIAESSSSVCRGYTQDFAAIQPYLIPLTFERLPMNQMFAEPGLALTGCRSSRAKALPIRG
jgi:hypothetical protein